MAATIAVSRGDNAALEPRWVVATLAVLILPYLSSNPAVSLGLLGGVFVAFTLAFVAVPRVAPVCIVISAAAGGVMIELAGKTPRLFYATVVMAAYVTSVLIRAALYTEDRAPGPIRESSRVALALTAYTVLMIPSLGQMVEPSRSLYTIACRAVAVVGVVLLLGERRLAKQREGLLLAMCAAGTIIAATYIINAIRFYGTSDLTQIAIGLAIKDNSVWAGALGATNTVASFLTLTFPLSIAVLGFPTIPRSARLLAIVGIWIQAFGIVSTVSRAAIVALIVGVVAASLLGQSSIRHVKRLLGFLLGAILAGILLVLVLQDAFRENLAARFALDAMQQSADTRFAIWRASWNAFISSPLFGIGIGNMTFFDRDFGSGIGNESHNLVFQLLAEEGALSALAMLFALSVIVMRALTFARRAGAARADLWILVALISVVVNSMLEPTFTSSPPFFTLFWVGAAFFYRWMGQHGAAPARESAT